MYSEQCILYIICISNKYFLNEKRRLYNKINLQITKSSIGNIKRKLSLKTSMYDVAFCINNVYVKLITKV